MASRKSGSQIISQSITNLAHGIVKHSLAPKAARRDLPLPSQAAPTTSEDAERLGIRISRATPSSPAPNAFTTGNNITPNDFAQLPAYTKVYVAVISWDYGTRNPDILQLDGELSGMIGLFSLNYKFACQRILVSQAAPELDLSTKLQNFYAGITGDATLAIIFYGGHGGRIDNSLIWAPLRTSNVSLNWSSVQEKAWSSIQNKSQTPCDQLLILDCCQGANAIPSQPGTLNDGRSTQYIISASDVTRGTSADPQFAFTKCLIATLRRMAPSFPRSIKPGQVPSSDPDKIEETHEGAPFIPEYLFNETVRDWQRSYGTLDGYGEVGLRAPESRPTYWSNRGNFDQTRAPPVPQKKIASLGAN